MTAAGTVLVVDDHELFSTSLVYLLGARGIGAQRCSSTDPDLVLAEAGGHEPGVVLLDLDLGNGPDGVEIDGCELVPPLRTDGWSVLVLTGSVDRTRIATAVALGAVGWVSKTASFPTLVQRAVDVLEGRSVMESNEHADLLALYREYHAAQQVARTKLDRLSAREREVLRLLADGQQAAAIASHFVTSLSTVRAQIRSILSKLEVTSQLAAVALTHRFPG
ncbi:MAG: LuxR C-terminal-related transcriptional regulator, partial [Sciscionella sp.]